jgi:murein DD-endopeptidase MepM/ murein hydrolase activator NlpD
MAVTATTSPIWAEESVEDLQEQQAELAEQAAAAAAEIDLLEAEDADIAAALATLDGWIAVVEADIDAAEQAIAAANEQARLAAVEVARLDVDIAILEDLLAARAVEAYVRPGGAGAAAVLEAEDLNTAARQRYLIDLTQDDITAVLDGIRVARASRDDQLQIAETSRLAADAERSDLESKLQELEDASAAQAAVRAELEQRIAAYQEETAQLAAADDELSALIRAAQQPPPVVTPLPVEEESPAATLEAEPTPTAVAPEPTAEPAGGGSGALQWPLAGPVVSGFGMRVHPIFGDSQMHTGLDIDANTGDPIGAAAAGTVIFVGWQDGYGNVVIVDHGSDMSTVYAHMSVTGTSEGASVTTGETVGQVGSTGYSTGPHLHFEVRIEGTAVDPRQYLP